MAKKQTIILTHGSGAPVYSKDDYKKGEVLVRHAGDAKDAALYTANNDEDGWIEFPSKAYVNAISETITGENGINKKLEALNASVEGLVAEDEAIRGEFVAADTELDGKISQLDTDYKDADKALTAEIAKKADSTIVNSIDTRLTTAEGAITALDTAYKAADAELDGKISQLDTDYKDADKALKNELNTEIAKKADSTIVNGIDGRLEAVEGEDKGKSMRTVAKAEVDAFKVLLYGEGTADVIDTLQDVINWIKSDESGATKIVADIAELQKVTSGYEGDKAIQNAVNSIDGRLATAEGEIDDLQAADTAIRGEFADADTALEGRLNTEIAQKADSTTVNSIDERLEAVEEAYVKEVEIIDTETNIAASVASNKLTLDFSDMVIDGGTY